MLHRSSAPGIVDRSDVETPIAIGRHREYVADPTAPIDSKRHRAKDSNPILSFTE